MAEHFWRLVVPGISTAIDGLGYARGSHRMGRRQKGNHKLQAEGKSGNGAKKNTPEHGKGKNGKGHNGRHDRTRHAR